jgi:hypothetical protein
MIWSAEGCPGACPKDVVRLRGAGAVNGFESRRRRRAIAATVAGPAGHHLTVSYSWNNYDAGVPPASSCVNGSQGLLLVTHIIRLSAGWFPLPTRSVPRASGFVQTTQGRATRPTLGRSRTRKILLLGRCSRKSKSRLKRPIMCNNGSKLRLTSHLFEVLIEPRQFLEEHVFHRLLPPITVRFRWKHH